MPSTHTPMRPYDKLFATWTSGPKSAPALPSDKLLGHQAGFREDPIATYLNAQQTMGDLVRLRFGPFWLHLLSDPAEVHAILVEKHRRYSKRTPGYEMLRMGLGDGLLTSEGELWKRQRRIAQPAFRKKEIESLTKVMTRAAVDLGRSWDKAARSGRPIDVAHAMSTLALRIAGETLFGVDLSDDSEEVSSALTFMLGGFNKMVTSPLPMLHRWPTPQRLRTEKALEHLDRVVHQIIADHRKGPEGSPTLLHMLIEAKGDDGRGMSDQQLRDEVITILLAGHETTATALAWTLYLLSKHPGERRRLEEELDATVHDEGATMADIEQLPFTTQVLKESMRLFPPAWTVGRRAEQDDEVLGYTIPKDSLVLMSPYLLHRHPKVWENPEGFDPDRFAPNRPQPPRGAYLPFLVGPRKCIGEHFAVTEAVIVLATLLKNFRLDLVPGQKANAEPSVTLRPKNGIHVTIHRR